MAYEIINAAQVTPHRLHAFVRLVVRLQDPPRQQLLDLLQPAALLEGTSPDETDIGPDREKQSAAGEVYRAAFNCQLICESDDRTRTVTLVGDPSGVESLESFRARMQKALFGVTDENVPNYLLNLYTAWYAAQNERVFNFGVTDFATRFNREMYPGRDGQAFNTTKLNGWQDWAAFLGFGWRIRPTSGNRRELLVPDATDRIRPLLPELLPQRAQVVLYRVFAEALAQCCPELDNGALFKLCWVASHPGEVQGNAISLMLSTALRTLHQSGAIELRREADATELWHLYPAPGYSLPGQITHIRRGTS